jgi:hypothetical protein
MSDQGICFEKQIPFFVLEKFLYKLPLGVV